MNNIVLKVKKRLKKNRRMKNLFLKRYIMNEL